ncbi:response regulator transcription factor [Kutzneria kofuensis]|uniref:DNA-binding NarL/FixJ family response regulator n=1 Tax=Kutzneria kofuensis TaxID=103725 RepID=A0A7W9NLS0_9PSEU|nr:response regulator transcription factor [Kutzneria kofuensis]MBB5896781.1 DNA-binding NarL/FixJ family response regulator [Kutzneria kofuensis]
MTTTLGRSHEDRSAVVADHKPIFRRGLRSLVEQCGITVAAEVSTMDDLHREVHLQDPALVIVNAKMLGKASGREVGRLRSSRRTCGDHRLLLTIYEDLAHAQQMLKAGSHGCVHNSADAEELKCAISTIFAGGYYLDARLGVRVLANDTPESRYKLTPRELKVLALISKGLTNKQIAETLHVSLRTVESHRACLKKKTGLRDRSELSGFAREHYPTMLSTDSQFSHA